MRVPPRSNGAHAAHSEFLIQIHSTVAMIMIRGGIWVGFVFGEWVTSSRPPILSRSEACPAPHHATARSHAVASSSQIQHRHMYLRWFCRTFREREHAKCPFRKFGLQDKCLQSPTEDPSVGGSPNESYCDLSG